MQVINIRLNIFRKKERRNRNDINKACNTIQDIKKCLRNAKKQYNSTIKVCISINNKVQGNKKELQKPIVEIIEVKNNYEKITMLRKNYMLLARDMEMILPKFVYEQFLSRKFRGKVIGEGEILLVSKNNRVKSEIEIARNQIDVTFERNTKSRTYYTEILINTNSIIIEKEFSRYIHTLKKTVNKSTYTEILNDKIITYSILKVVRRNVSNIIYAKEEMYYDNLKNILNNEIIICIRKICKRVEK